LLSPRNYTQTEVNQSVLTDIKFQRIGPPEDWQEVPGKYDPRLVKIQEAWDIFHASAKKVQTKSGKDATFFPPWLPWYLVKEGDNLVAIHLNWCPFYVWKLCRGRHPSAANDDNGILHSATWELWRSALGGGGLYAKCIKVNACPVVFDYSGDVLDIYDQDELDEINSLYRIFIEILMTVVTKNALCSKGVVARYKNGVFGGERSISNFLKKNSDKFFLKGSSSNVSSKLLVQPVHPERLLNPIYHGHNFENECKEFDNHASLVGSILSGNDDFCCSLGSDIFNEVESSPGYLLKKEASRQALQRAHEATRELVKQRKHIFQDPKFIKRNRKRQLKLVRQRLHIFQDKDFREENRKRQLALVDNNAHIFQDEDFIEENRKHQLALVDNNAHIFQDEDFIEEHREENRQYQQAQVDNNAHIFQDEDFIEEYREEHRKFQQAQVDNNAHIFQDEDFIEEYREEHRKFQLALFDINAHPFQEQQHSSVKTEVNRLVMEMTQALEVENCSATEEAVTVLSQLQSVRDLRDKVKELHVVSQYHRTYMNAKKNEKFTITLNEKKVQLAVVVRPSDHLQTSIDLVTAIGAVMRESSLLYSEKRQLIVETIINILKPPNNPTGRRDLALQQGASMDVNDALRTAITEFNQGEKSLEEFRVFFVKKNKTFAEPEHAGLKVFNLFTETNKKSALAAKLNQIAKHSSVKNLIKGFQNVNLKDAENFISQSSKKPYNVQVGSTCTY
jgi:hypothetical protein